MEKKTKITYFSDLREIIEATVEDSAQREDLIEFIDKQIAILEKRKVSAVARAERKKAEGDELTDLIFAQLGEDPKTIDEIIVAFDENAIILPDGEEVTRNKIAARLGKLIKTGSVVKEPVKVGKARRMAYRLADEADDNEE